MPRKKQNHPLSAISKEQWKSLIEASLRIAEMKPWTWMEESDVFGIQPVGAEFPSFVSVMGSFGEYCSMALYDSPAATHQILRLQQNADDNRMDEVLETPHLQAIFGSAADLSPEEKTIVKSLGISPRGRSAWPYYKSFRPGYAPWFIEPGEVSRLLLAMEQLLEFAPRFKKDPSILPEIGSTGRFWVRIQEVQDGHAVWREEVREYPQELKRLRIAIPQSVVDGMRFIPVTDMCVELDAPLIHHFLGKPGERPRFPYLLILVESESLYSFGVEMMTVETTLEALWEQFPGRVLKALLKHKIKPSTLRVNNAWLQMILSPICGELGIQVQRCNRLPALERVRMDIDRFI